MVDTPIRGIFIRELKNRFLCEVLIDKTLTECYVPSSCRLDNFLELHGKQVLLLPTRTANSRTKYSLLAVPYKRNYILLNTSRVNSIIAESLHRKIFSKLGDRTNISKEYRLGKYKSDLYLPVSKTIVEIKSVISLGDIAKFPTVYSQRTLEQLVAISSLIDDGFKAVLIIVSLSPYVREIHIDRDSPFFAELLPCINKGLQLLAVSTYITEGNILVKRKIKIVY